MPELPEVETVVRALRPQLVKRKIIEARCFWPRHIDRPDYAQFMARIRGLTFQEATRRGKFLVFPMDLGETLIIHLRMSGHLFLAAAVDPVDKHSHTIFALDNGQELRFRDTRKFGRVYLVEDPQEVVGKLGPEPLEDDFTPGSLQEIIKGRKRQIKPLLLDQTMIAGIGNIYADEALFQARVQPTRKANSLSRAEIAHLYEGIRMVLNLGIQREGASIDSYTKPDGEKGEMQNAVMVFRRTGAACYVCGRPIQRAIVGGRSTHFCAYCQK